MKVKKDTQLNKSGSFKCVRCSNSVSSKGGRCSDCLAKLRRDKKTPGHSQRAQTKADDALRRQKGDNGTAPGTSKGHGSRKEIVDKIQNAEKKTGQKLSPDRKDNSSGYSSENVRAVPERLNRGRHKVDPKKLSEWKKRLKKTELTAEEILTLLCSAAYNKSNNELAAALTDNGLKLVQSILGY